MSTPFSTEVRTLFRLLEDRQWHDFRDIKERLANTVAPGKALRRYEDRLATRRERGGHAAMPSEPSEDEKIMFGQRLVADNTMQGLKRRWLDIDHEGGGFGRKAIRLKPGVEIQPSSPMPSAPLSHAEEDELDEVFPEPQQRALDVLSGPAEVFEPDDADDDDDEPADTSEMALFSEVEVRKIVAQEVGQQLDAFQRGMQEWLTEWFGDRDHKCLLRDLHGKGGVFGRP